MNMMNRQGGSVTDDCYVVASNLPKELHRYNTLKDYFRPLNLKGKDTVKMMFDHEGNNLGLAYVKFANSMECRQVSLE